MRFLLDPSNTQVVSRKRNTGVSLSKRPVVQPKLELTQPGDSHEQEADRMADFVMRKACGNLPSKMSSATSTLPPVISRKASGSSAVAVSAATESGINASRGEGQPMPEALRAKMESGFGADFSGVRLHTGSRAADLSGNLQAKAFTCGNDIFFNRGQYQPHSAAGQHLIAHELTHVVQQGEKVGREPDFSGSPSPDIQNEISKNANGRTSSFVLNDKEQMKVRGDFQLARGITEKCIEVLDEIKDGNNQHLPLFVKNFGDMDIKGNNFERIKRYYEIILRAFNRKILFFRDRNSDDYAYVFVHDGQNAIVLGNTYFKHHSVTRAATIIHELSHERAYTNDTYDPNAFSRYSDEKYERDALSLAANNKIRYTSHNADNYYLFAKDVAKSFGLK